MDVCKEWFLISRCVKQWVDQRMSAVLRNDGVVDDEGIKWERKRELMKSVVGKDEAGHASWWRCYSRARRRTVELWHGSEWICIP